MTDKSKVVNLPADVAAEPPKAIQKTSTVKTKSIAGLVPETLDDVYRMSNALARAGQMVPQHFQGQPDAIMAALLRGMEIGLAPMQALSSIAVINGRASLWGDALPAMMQKAGHQIDTEISGEGDAMKATATLIRGDTGQKIVREFSVGDARKAQLWDKKGPWQSYPKRMLTHRARSWAVRDGAADALMGLQIAEEVQDYQPMRDVTPEPSTSGFAKLAAQARQEAVAPNPPQNDDNGPHDAKIDPSGENEAETPSDETQPEAEDAENAEDQADAAEDLEPEGEPEPKPKLTMEEVEGLAMGQDAFHEGKDLTDCPLEDDDPRLSGWIKGWRAAKSESQ